MMEIIEIAFSDASWGIVWNWLKGKNGMDLLLFLGILGLIATIWDFIMGKQERNNDY